MVGATHNIQMPGSQAEAWYGVSLCLKLNYNTSTANLFSGVSYADIRNEKFSFDKKFSFGDRFGTTSRESNPPILLS